MTVIQNKEPKKRAEWPWDILNWIKFKTSQEIACFPFCLKVKYACVNVKKILTPCLPSVSFVADVEAVD